MKHLLLFLQRRPDRWQKYVLTRHFLMRYFVGDSLSFEEQRREKLIAFFAFLGTAGLVISSKLYFGYLISGLTGQTAAGIWRERTVFMTDFMILSAIVSVFTWNAMFPDRKDYNNLLCRPLSLGAILFAKFVSQLAFITMTTLAVTLPAAIVAALYVGNVVKTATLAYFFIQFATYFMAGLFVYFGLFVLQGMLLLLPHRLYQRASLYVQVLLLGGCALLYSAFPRFLPRLSVASGLGQGLAATPSHMGLAIWYPPLWFVGLGEWSTGNGKPLYAMHAVLALCAIVVPILFYRTFFNLSYRRHLRVLPDAAPRRSRGFFSLRRTLAAFYLKTPVQRALYDFTLQTMKASRYHRFIMGIAVMIPLSHALVHMLYGAPGGDLFSVDNFRLLSFTIVFIPFIVLGLRYAVSVPLIIEANWAFKLHFPESEKNDLSGMKLAFWKNYFYPLLLVSFLLYNFAGGPITALMLTAYDAALLFIFQEWAFLQFQKIPFTSNSTLVAFNVKAYWPFCLVGFFAFVGFFTSSKHKLVQSAGAAIYIVAGFLFLHLLYLRLRRRRLSYDTPLAFDEDLEPIMLSLNLE